jgi:predicted lipid-binding transport protein (Tim44 family)
MNQAFDPLNLLLLAVAVVVFLRLRSVLGRRTGTERPPLDTTKLGRKPEAQGNVITLPPRDPPPARPSDPEEEIPPVWKGYAEEGSQLAQAFEQIAAADPSFSPKDFLSGAKPAYEMIVTAFAEGDKPSLKTLLSKDVFEGFATAIDSRERSGEKLESRFVGIDKAEIAAASLIAKRASITVNFLSQLISATRNRAGEVIDGDPAQIREVNDVWTFERDTSSNDPNWKLVATEDRS